MFNLKKHKTAQITSTEKYLRRDNLGPSADDQQAICEKELTHRKGDVATTTEDRIQSLHSTPEGGHDKESQVIEKVLNERSSYVVHRNDQSSTSIHPHNVLVEKLRQNRLDKDWKPEKKPHWSQTFDESKQQGALPKWPNSPAQVDVISLNNDPRRFEGVKNMPTSEKQSENDKARNRSNTIRPLVGNITTASVHVVADKIKSGASVDYDTAIVAILREAEKEKRELTPVEQKTISELKIARTQAMLK